MAEIRSVFGKGLHLATLFCIISSGCDIKASQIGRITINRDLPPTSNPPYMSSIVDESNERCFSNSSMSINTKSSELFAYTFGHKTAQNVLFSATTSFFERPWNELFDTYAIVLWEESILRAQYEAFLLSQAPTSASADPRLKEIPIHENGEALIDLRHVGHERIQMLPDPETPFASPVCNSGLPNASKIRVSLFIALQKMVTILDELAPHFGYEPGQITIKVFEGLRDLTTQKMLFERKLQEILLANPSFTLEIAEQETTKLIAPVKNNVPVHSTGAAVDFGLYDTKSNRILDMGTFGVIWGGNDNASTFSENITGEQKRNRLYLLIAAEKAGLINYLNEFWHFSLGDRYYAYWKKQSQAVYGPIQ